MSLVPLAELKDRVKRYPLSWSVRSLILQEPDLIEESEFKVKAKTWLSLLEIELMRKNGFLGASSDATLSAKAVSEGVL